MFAVKYDKNLFLQIPAGNKHFSPEFAKLFALTFFKF